MLLILWGILKAIGIVLLFLILLFILVIFLILSVPVRYKINFKYTDRADCYICVSWLVHFIHIEYSTADGAVFKVCGIGILKRKINLLSLTGIRQINRIKLLKLMKIAEYLLAPP